MSFTDNDISTDPSDYSDLGESSNKSQIASLFSHQNTHPGFYPMVSQAVITNLCVKTIPSTSINEYNHSTKSEEKADCIKIETEHRKDVNISLNLRKINDSLSSRRFALQQLSLNELLTKTLLCNVSVPWNIEWCRYCGARASHSFLSSPWGRNKLCYLHHNMWKTQQLNLSMIPEPMDIKSAINTSECTEKQYLINVLLTEEPITHKQQSKRNIIKKEIKVSISKSQHCISDLSDFESESESFYSSFSASDCESSNNTDHDHINISKSSFLSEPLSTNTVLKIESSGTVNMNSLFMINYDKLFIPNNTAFLSEPLSNNIKLKLEPITDFKIKKEIIERDSNNKQHWREHLLLPIKCNVCDKCCTTHSGFRYHMKHSHGIKQAYKCMKCVTKDIRYASKAGLHEHIERDHEKIRRFKCKLCPKAFYRKSTFEKHQRVHDGKKPFKCNDCGLRCSQKSSLRQHIIAVHLKQKNYKCKYCGKGFAASTTMKSHMVSRHSDAKYARFECDKCYKRFYEKSSYVKHSQIAHRWSHPIQQMIKNGNCPYINCNKKYSSKNKAASVKYHLVTKHKDRRYANYECKKCDKLFYDKTGYTEHKHAKH